jgi:hydroxymethylpyrimidine/phosphomethylpyrimidine kinase
MAAVGVAVARALCYASRMDGRVLTIAGSDSGGGAGIQADIKTITALGGYAMTAITALTAQNTVSVSEVFAVDPFFVESQVVAVLEDIGADSIKIGMLANRANVELLARKLDQYARRIPVVLDPVMVATSGTRLLDDAGIQAMRTRLVTRCALITPNIPEAEILTQTTIRDEGDMHRAADLLLLAGAPAVLIKGGHLPGETLVDLLRTADGMEKRFESERQNTRATHGTGCTLSAAIATGLAQGMTLESAVARGIDFVQRAMRWAKPLGNGQAGPLDHGFLLRQRSDSEPLH